MYKSVFALFLFVVIFSTAVAVGAEIDSVMAVGDSLYALNRYDESITYYKQACQMDSSKFEPFWKLGRSINLKGELAPKDSQLVVFEAARDAEAHALELNESSADAHFQMARALGKIALFKGIFKSVGLAKKVREECLRALELDSLHDGAWHILGRWNREVGKKPKFLRVPMGLGAANKEDAIAFMQKAIEINPNYIHHHLEMGITYDTYKKKDLARQQFEKCLELPTQRPLDEIYQKEAKKYLAELDKK